MLRDGAEKEYQEAGKRVTDMETELDREMKRPITLQKSSLLWVSVVAITICIIALQLI